MTSAGKLNMLVGFAKLVELVALDPGAEPPLLPTLLRRIPETFLVRIVIQRQQPVV